MNERYKIEDQGEHGYAVFDTHIGQIIAKGFSSYEQAENFIDDDAERNSTLLDIS